MGFIRFYVGFCSRCEVMESISFIKVLYVWNVVWVLSRNLAWRPFDLEQVFIGVERSPVNVLFGEIACAGNAFDQ